MSSVIETIRNAAFVILIYARFSKEDQNRHSTADQIQSIRYYLEDEGFDSSNIIVETDEGISGEMLSRPGIDRVRELVARRKVHLVIAEDVGRLFRDRAEPLKFGGHCEDHDVRLIAIEDNVDTATSDWKDRMADAGKKHAASNEAVSYRTKRAARGRFDASYAMGPKKPGYIRKPIDPEDYERRRRGPFVDEIDPKLKPIAEEAYRRIARGDRPRIVADFMTENEYPRSHNTKTPRWSDSSLKKWIRNPIHKGVEQFRKSVSKIHNASGGRRQRANDRNRVLRRDMPHLAMVTEDLWQRANDAIDARDTVKAERRRGHEHNLHAIPRDSRTPLANHFFCGICGGKMISQGRAGGGYRCGNGLRDECWNRATVQLDYTLQAIAQTIIDRLLSLEGAVDALVDLVANLVEGRHDLESQLDRKKAEIRKVDSKIAKLVARSLEAPKVRTYNEMLLQEEGAKAHLQKEIDKIDEELSRERPMVDRETILSRVDEITGELASDDCTFELVRALTTKVEAVPFQRIDCGLVVLRARFTLNLGQLLPDEWQSCLASRETAISDHALTSTVIEVKLHEEPVPVVHAPEAFRLSLQEDPNLTASQIADSLGISRRSTYAATNLGKLMESEGLSEPYRELTAEPPNASRWGKRASGNADEA